MRLTPPHSPTQYRNTQISKINPGMSVRGCLLSSVGMHDIIGTRQRFHTAYTPGPQ